MDIRDKMKKYGKEFLSQTAKYSKHKPTTKVQKQISPNIERLPTQNEPEHQLLPWDSVVKALLSSLLRITFVS